MITSLPYIPAKAEELKKGIGIYNHILTGQTGLQTTYKVKFYYTEKIEVTPAQGDNPAVYRYEYKEFSLPEEYGLKDENGKLVYLESDGQIVLEQGQAVDFISSSNTTFQNFLINNEITRIVIDVVCEEMRDGDKVKAYEQYDSVTGFIGSDAEYDSDTNTTGDPADAANIPSTREIYKIQYDTESREIIGKSNYNLMQYNLTPMVDYDVYVQWRDTNLPRPDRSTVMFDISRDNEPYIKGKSGTGENYGGVYAGTDPPENVSRKITEIDSNNILYTYSVPEYSPPAENSPDGQKYTYGADEKAIKDYYIDRSDSSHFTNYHLTDFSCKINWKDYAHKDDIHKNITSDFIISHFELLDETVDGFVYNALKVKKSDLEKTGFPEETKKFIESKSTYTEVNEKYHKITAEALEALTLPEQMKELIRENSEAVTEDGETSYKITDDIFSNINFISIINSSFQVLEK